MPDPAAGSRYHTLDHWRGFAALWVLVYHGNRGHPELAPDWLGRFVTHGWLGVPVFFVISGYCIAERTAREQAWHGSAQAFMRDRLLRIYPPYWAAVILSLGLNVAGALAKGRPLSAPFVLPDGLAGAVAALGAVEPWFDRPTYLLVAWTLSYEIGFYLCAAAGIALAMRTRRPWLGPLWWGALLALGFMPAVTRLIPLLALWPHFALGGIVWLSWQGSASVGVRLLRGTAAVGLVWLAAATLPVGGAHALSFSCVCAWLLVWLRPADHRLAQTPLLGWLGWVGTFAYSLYLVHVPIVGKFGNLMERWPPLAAHPLLLLVLSCLLTLPCAWLFYRTIELRCEAFRKRQSRAAGIIPPATAPASSRT
jgi:peptidoglycan/LPS O-acetylase OafA/YrhL